MTDEPVPKAPKEDDERGSRTIRIDSGTRGVQDALRAKNASALAEQLARQAARDPKSDGIDRKLLVSLCRRAATAYIGRPKGAMIIELPAE